MDSVNFERQLLDFDPIASSIPLLTKLRYMTLNLERAPIEQVKFKMVVGLVAPV